MRRLIIYILVCVALCACSESNSEVDSTQQKVLFNIEVSAPDTRTALVNEDGKYKAIWKEGDFYIVAQIAEKESSFCTGTVEADTPSIKVVAEFEQTEGSSYRYLFASPNLAVSADCTTLGFPLPSRQSPQGMDTFDGAADVILSDVIEFANQPSDQTVTFNTKRVSAVGKVTVKNVALAEGDAVRSIIFACEHPLAGDVTNVVVEDIVAGNDPLTNSIIESASNTITVMLHEPQTGEFTCFFSCLPATLAAGESYIVTLNTEQNHSFVKQAKIPSDLSFTSGRMTTFTVNMAGIVADAPAVDSANCQILYTSTDGNVVTPYATDVFGATIVSNTYENGQGVITFDGEVTKIGGSAFRGCTNLKTLNIPNSVTSIERWAFLDCDSLEEFFGSNIISNGRAVVVNGTMIAFAQGGLTSYALPSEVTAVDVSVFESCDKLTEISLGENINTIGGSAFDSCIGITSITIPQSVTTIGNNAFHSCTKLGTVYVESATPPTGEDYMFNNNAADRKIYVPAASVEAYKSAQYWSDYADAIFADADPANCQILYTSTDGNVVTPNNADIFGANIVSNIYENGQGVIKFDGEVTKIGYMAFRERSTLASIVIPQSVTSIGRYAFHCNTALTTITLPESVTAIDLNPFIGCTNLAEFKGKFATSDGRSLVVDNSLHAIAPAGITEYAVPENVTAICDDTFNACGSITSVTIPDSVISIGNYAFYSCGQLENVEIGNGVTTIGGSAFHACGSLTSITIPGSVTLIGETAFYDCRSLQSVYCKPITPPTMGAFAIYYVSGANIYPINCQIYVPAASVEAYKAAEGWSEYADAIVAEDGGNGDVTIADIDMVFVAGGTFTMGSDDSDAESNEKPTHSVTVSDFYIGKYEVTQAQWRAVMGSNPSYFTGDDLPVENVSWNDIQVFITKLNVQTGRNYRLPTEAEWEYAARGSNESKGYKYSGSNTIDDVAWYYDYDNSNSTTHAVGQKQPNELGIYDMSGNVAEWCQDWFGSYSSDSQTNPTGPESGSSRVLRGGSWNGRARYCRVSSRSILNPGYRLSGNGGFRLCLSE